MNAKDLITALRGHETVTFEIRNLGSTTYKTKEFEEAVNEIEYALSRSRTPDTATEPPTRKDGDECGCVLAKRSDLPYGKWGLAHITDVRGNTNLYVQWTQLPEAPHDNT